MTSQEKSPTEPVSEPDDMIERLQKNEKPNFLLTDDEFACLELAGYKNREYTNSSHWPDWWEDKDSTFPRNAPTVYRLIKDYEPKKPEPEVVECKVWEDGDLVYLPVGLSNREDCNYLEEALHDPTWTGKVRMADGTIYKGLRRPSEIKGEPAESPVRVLFAKAK